MTSQTETILDYFEQINAIPRCSKNETALRHWLQTWAQNNGFSNESDSAGNLVVRVPATQGCEQCPVVVIQGHMDMVCEKTPESGHDFTSDPIVSQRQGDWLIAGDTTLGADNGIAIAYSMCLAEADCVHPPLELLFTVDEETGLNGAKALPPGFIDGRRLINLDSEDEGVFTIGCAGGIDTVITRTLDTRSVGDEKMILQLVVGGLRGGHSGIDIHKGRGNANKILARLLDGIHGEAPLWLIALEGGTRKNAIPRDAWATFAVEASQFGAVQRAIGTLERDILQEAAASDAGIRITLASADIAMAGYSCLTADDSRYVRNLLLALPNGVYGMSARDPASVETSCNLAIVALASGRLSITSSQRSASMSRLTEMTSMVHAVADLAGADVQDKDIYYPWPPDPNSDLLRRAMQTFRELYGDEPVTQVIHAGLECAVIGSIYEGMDMISFGPTIRNPHAPGERLLIPSIETVWRFLTALMAAMTES